MSIQKFSWQGEEKDVAKLLGRNLPISRKEAWEIAGFIKGKNVDRAIGELNRIATAKLAIPYKRFKKDTPHRRGKMAAGRFPKNASLEIIRLLKGLKSNAEVQGLDPENLIIIHAASQHTGLAWHYGRHRGRRRKLCHFELIAKEGEAEKKKPKKREVKKAEVKTAPAHIDKAAPEKEEKLAREEPKREEKKIEPKTEEKPEPLKGIEMIKPVPKKEAKK